MGQIILRLTVGSNAVGPFNVYVDTLDSDPVISATTRFNLQKGEVLELDGSINGTEYTIFIKEDKEICDSPTISKKVVIYDDETEILLNKRIPTTPSATPLLNYDLYLYKKCVSSSETIERKFFNIKRLFTSTDFLYYDGECYVKENGPLDANPKHPYIEDGFFDDCFSCQNSIIKDYEKNKQAPPPFYYAVWARSCCDLTAPSIQVNLNYSFIISNIFGGSTSPGPTWSPPTGYSFYYEDNIHAASCWLVVQAFPYMWNSAPNVNSQLFKGCKDCTKIIPCTKIYKATACFTGVVPYQITVVAEDGVVINESNLNNSINVFTYNDVCYYVSDVLNISPSGNEFDITDLINENIKCSSCYEPPRWSYTIKDDCCPATNDGIYTFVTGPYGLTLGNSIFYNGECQTIINIWEEDLGYPYAGTNVYDDCDVCLDTLSGGHSICPTASVTPTPTPTPQTPTPTPAPTTTPTNTPTLSLSPTKSPLIIFTCYLLNCCDENEGIVIKMMFDGGVSPQVGWVVVYNNKCYKISVINYPISFGSPTVYFPSSVIFTSMNDDLNCQNCVDLVEPICSSTTFAGCTSGNIFSIPFATQFGCTVGNTYIFSNSQNNDVFVNLTTNDLCFTCIQNTGQQQTTLIGIATDASEISCTNTECVYIAPSPTVTPTPTVTPFRKIIKYVACCSFAGPFYGYVDYSFNVSVNDVIRIGLNSCFIVEEIITNNTNINGADIVNLTLINLQVYSSSEYETPCSICECDADPFCEDPNLICSTTPTPTPTITPSITPTYTPTPTITRTPTVTPYRMKIRAKSCCDESLTRRFWVPLNSQVGQSFVYTGSFTNLDELYGPCWEIIELNVTGNVMSQEMMDPQFTNGCADCQDNYVLTTLCPTQTPTKTPAPTPTPSNNVPEPDPDPIYDPCLCPNTKLQQLPYLHYNVQDCCGVSISPYSGATYPSRTNVFFSFDISNEFSQPYTINSNYFKNLTTVYNWIKIVNFFGSVSTIYDDGYHPPKYEVAKDYKAGPLPFKPFFDSPGSSNIDFYTTYYHQIQSWMSFFGPKLSYYSFYQQMNDIANNYISWGIVEDDGNNLTKNIDPITKNRYGNNLPAGLMRINGQLTGFNNLQNWSDGGEQWIDTLDEGGGQTTIDYGNITPYITPFSTTPINSLYAKKLVIIITNPDHLNWGPNNNNNYNGENLTENDPSRVWFQTRFIVEGMKSPYAGWLGNALDPHMVIQDPNDIEIYYKTQVFHQEIIAIGIGEGKDWPYLEQLASYPDYVHKLDNFNQLEDPNFQCDINANLCDLSRYGYLYLSGLTTGFIYVFHPLTKFYNYRLGVVQTGPLNIFTIGDIVSGNTYQKLSGKPTDYGEFTQIRALSYNGEKVVNWETKYKVVGYNDVYQDGKFIYHDWWSGQPMQEPLPYEGDTLIDKFFTNNQEIVYYFQKLYEFGYDCDQPGCPDQENPPVLTIPSGVDLPQETQVFTGTIRIRIDIAQEILDFGSYNDLLSVGTECGERIVETFTNTDEILFNVEYDVFIHDNSDLDGLNRFEYHSWIIENYGGFAESGYHKGIILSKSDSTALGIAELPGFTCKLAVNSQDMLLYSLLDEVCVHELGHTFGLHHTFSCDKERWKTMYPSLVYESLDNNLPNTSFSECLRCGDYQAYYDETDGASAYMSYNKFRTSLCGSVRNTLGPLDSDYVEPNRLKYNLNLSNSTTTINDFIFDPMYDTNYVTIVGYDKKPNIIYKKFALNNEYTYPQVNSIQVSFTIKGTYNGIAGDDLSVLNVKVVNSSGGNLQIYSKGVNELTNNVPINVSYTLNNTNGGLSLFDYSDQESLGVKFEIYRLAPESEGQWYFIISNLKISFIVGGQQFITKPKDYHHILSDSTGDTEMKSTDCEINFANKFTSYEGEIIQYYVNSLKNYFDL